jgi:hypothetical protein
MNGDTARPLKRAVIREELVALTGDVMQAVVLNQFLYWTERVRDFDAFVEEEKERDPELQLQPRQGWIYKTAAQMAEETMLTVSESTMNRYMSALVKEGFLLRRNNPAHRWDRTYQYRVDLYEIQERLEALGYHLEGWRFDAACKPQNAGSTHHSAGAIPEITTETTPNTRSPKGSQAEQPALIPFSTVKKDSVRTSVTRHFRKETGLKIPPSMTEGGMRKLWWNPIQEICGLCEYDESAAKRLISAAVERMRKQNLTISNPNSILNVARAIDAERKIPKATTTAWQRMG